jgi:hypothetical protein
MTIQLKLEENFMFCRFQCLSCGDSFRLGLAAIKVHIDGDYSGNVICEGCLREGSNGIQKRLKKRVQFLFNYAESLDYLSEQDFDVPTFEEYEKFIEQLPQSQIVDHQETQGELIDDRDRDLLQELEDL